MLALTVVGALVVVGGAFAYFTSTGTGTGSASVGSASTWTVNTSPYTGGPLYPGSGSETISYTVTNASTGHQGLTATSASVAQVASGANAGDITQSGTAVPGCLASWFTAVNSAPTPLPQDLAGGATSSAGSVAVTMQDPNVNQDACEGAAPDITVNAS